MQIYTEIIMRGGRSNVAVAADDATNFNNAIRKNRHHYYQRGGEQQRVFTVHCLFYERMWLGNKGLGMV